MKVYAVVRGYDCEYLDVFSTYEKAEAFVLSENPQWERPGAAVVPAAVGGGGRGR